MRPRRPPAEHQEAVSRRLALLGAELAAVRAAAPGDPPGQRFDQRSDERSDPARETDAGQEWWHEHTRVRRPGDAAPEPPPAALPVPGRHAARRSGGLPAAVPDTLRGRVALGAPQVAVLAVLVAVGLAVTCWWVVRGAADPEQVAPVAAPAGSAAPLVTVPTSPGSSTAASPPSAGATAEQAAAAGTVTVDVAGKVRSPGIAVLPAGSRVVDALEAAGGARPGVDLTGLNLARLLVDGEQVLVGVAGPPGVAPSVLTTAVPSAGAPTALVDLNAATQQQLETLPEVGPVTAAAILAWRDEHGGFTAVDELLEVDGIGEATLAKIAPHVTV